MDEIIRRLVEAIWELRESLQSRDPQRVRATVRRIVAGVEVKAERRLVGKVKHRYFLVGGDIMRRAGSGLNPVVGKGGRLPLTPEGARAWRVISSENLSYAEPTPSPR